MNRVLLIPCICFLAFFLVLPGSAAQAQWRRYANTDDIRALFRQGDTLWIGTNGGVLRYNLLTGEIEIPGEITRRLPSQSVRAIAERGGVLYIGTDRGLLVSGPDGIDTYSISSRSYFADIWRISFSYSGGIYLGTFGHGAVRLQDGKSFVITRTDSLLGDKVYSVYQPDAKTTYFATALGICAYKDDAWINYQAGYGLPRGEVLWIEPLDRKEFYLLIGGKGIYRFDGVRGHRIPLEGHFEEQDIAAIAVAQDGALWAAGRYGGLQRYQYGDWTAYDESDPEVKTAQWRCAHADDQGDVFFGASNGLIARITNGELSTFKVISSLPSNSVPLVVETPSGGLLLKSGSRLVKYSAERFEPLATPGHVVSLAVAPDSSFWYATRWGLFRQADGSVREMTPELAGLRNYFTSLAFDNTGGLWAGSYFGNVYRFDGELWLTAGYSDELFGGSIDQLAIDSRNGVWALDRSSGVSRFSGGVWDHFPKSLFGADSLKALVIDTMGYPALLLNSAVWRYRDTDGWYQQNISETRGYYEAFNFDSKGTLFLGSTEFLIVAAQDTTSSVEIPAELHGAEMAALLVDSQDRLWIGFRNGGLARVRISDLR